MVPADGVVGDVLDPALLPVEGAKITVKYNPLFKAGDVLTLFCDGVTSSGTDLPHPSIVIPVTGSIDGGADASRFVPKAFITSLLNGRAAVYYTLNKNGGETLTSLKLVLQVKSQGAQLPKPTIDFAVGDQLDPAAVPANGTTVRINYTPMEEYDRLHLHFNFVYGSSFWCNPTFFPYNDVGTGAACVSVDSKPYFQRLIADHPPWFPSTLCVGTTPKGVDTKNVSPPQTPHSVWVGV